MIDNVEELIKSRLQFNGVSGQGWNTIYCEVCGDGGRTKGPRGGWRFDGAATCFYHCFNCGINASFSTEREHAYSKNMWRVFEAFGIPEKDHKALIAITRFENKDFVKPKKREVKFDPIEIPDHFYPLEKSDNAMAEKARKFLEIRKIDPDSYSFYLSTGISKKGPREEAIARAMFNRLIIPAFHKDNMIYYQARIMEETTKGKYINPSISRSSIIYGYDKLFKNTDIPLYITEGFFDSHHLDGVAVLENKLSSPQIEMLSKSARRKIVVPDKRLKKDQKEFDDGKELIRQAIELGWEVAFPNYGGESDVTRAIQQYGRIHVLNSIAENIKSGFSAEIATKFW